MMNQHKNIQFVNTSSTLTTPVRSTTPTITNKNSIQCTNTNSIFITSIIFTTITMIIGFIIIYFICKIKKQMIRLKNENQI